MLRFFRASSYESFILWVQMCKQKQRITEFDITVFLRQLATLISAGIPLIQSCELLEKSQVKVTVRLLIYSIKRDMLTGKELFYCLRSHQSYFDELTCQLINIGEHTGKLDIMLNVVADLQEKIIAFKKRIKQALFYPCMITFTALIVTGSMLIFVIPRFAELFQETQTTLPFLTKCIFFLSKQLQKHVFLLALPVLLGIFAYCYHPLSLHMKRTLKQMLLRFPPLRLGLQKIVLARFARNLAITFAAGIPINKALKLAANASGSTELHELVQKLRRHLNSGLSLHLAMESLQEFPDLMIQMIKIGEESGMLAEMLNKTADFFEADIDQFINHFSQLLEPLIMLVLGVLIGGLVIGMYLPIFKLGTAL